jgi:hypothetical protein
MNLVAEKHSQNHPINKTGYPSGIDKGEGIVIG